MKTILICLVLIGSLVGARAHSPVFSATSPSGGQRGSEMELVFRGERLGDAQEILFYSPGIEVVKLEEIKSSSIKAKIQIAADCRLGEHALRVRTATGLSALRTFYVGAFPSVEEVEPNNEPTKAQKILMNTTVSGSAVGEDVDLYSVEAKKGERLSVEIEGIRLGRGMADPYVAIQDQSGKILAACDDTALLLQDPFVSLIVPHDGTYLIQVHESAYVNGTAYRMHVGNFPRPVAVYPAGGPAGENLSVKFIGDVAGDFTQKFKLPFASQARFGVFAEQAGSLAPSPNWLRVSPFPNVLEAGPNQDAAHATKTDLSLPLAFNGVLAKDGEADWFAFKAKKGQAIEVNVYARRIRSPVDSIVQIFDINGKSLLAQNDDSVGSDSALRFTPPADGEYFFKVTDHLGKGGPDYTYRVELDEIRPSVALSIGDVARQDTQTRKWAVVHKGNRYAALLNVTRNNFNGDLALSLEGAPTGIRMNAEIIPSGRTPVPVVFEATTDAIIAGTLADLIAKSTDPAKDVQGHFQQVVEFVYFNQQNYYQTKVDKFAVAVAEEVPFRVSIVESKTPLVQNGSLDLKIVAERQSGFDEPINVRMLYNPPGVGSLPDVTIPKGANSVEYHLNASVGAETRIWKIAVTASAKVSGGPAWISSQLANLEVAPAFLLGKIDMTTIEQGKPARVVCKLDQKTPFAGKATVKLLGLPAGATATEAQISKDDKEAVFMVTTAANTPTGFHKGLFCAVSIHQSDEIISQNMGSGGVLRVDAPKMKVADAKVSDKTSPSVVDKKSPIKSK